MAGNSVDKSVIGCFNGFGNIKDVKYNAFLRVPKQHYNIDAMLI